MHPRKTSPPWIDRFLPSSQAWESAIYVDIDTENQNYPDIKHDVLQKNKKFIGSFQQVIDLCPDTVKFHDQTRNIRKIYFKNMFSWLKPGGEFVMPLRMSLEDSMISCFPERLPLSWVYALEIYDWTKYFLWYYNENSINSGDLKLLSPTHIHRLVFYNQISRRLTKSFHAREGERMLAFLISRQCAYMIVKSWLGSRKSSSLHKHKKNLIRNYENKIKHEMISLLGKHA
ncbi:MAG: hypothetical protein EOP45_17400, partial [Sphingobacteriaceae bacterium]